jgi:hypothetical protein
MVAGSGIWRTSCLREASSSAILSFILLLRKITRPQTFGKMKKQKTKKCLGQKGSLTTHLGTSLGKGHTTSITPPGEPSSRVAEGATVIISGPSVRGLNSLAE